MIPLRVIFHPDISPWDQSDGDTHGTVASFAQIDAGSSTQKMNKTSQPMLEYDELSQLAAGLVLS